MATNPPANQIGRFAGNAASYTIKKLYVLIECTPTTPKAFTQEAWIYTTTDSTANKPILGFENDTGQNAPSISVSDNNAIKFSYSDFNGALLSASTAPILNPTTWHHVATTFDGTTLKIYVDGIVRLSDASTFAGKPPVHLPVKWIGRDKDSYFDGRIAQVRVWNVARTADQIVQAMSRPQLTPALGQYIVTSTDTSLGTVARPFNLRLIVHKSDTEARLFQRIYHGLGLGTNTVLTAQENLLHPNLLKSARRISSVHLPFSEVNSGWLFTGQFAQGQTISVTVTVVHFDQESNPFLHRYHPDHDNLNVTFDGAASRGAESYDIERKITLVIATPAQDFRSVIAGGNEIIGQYAEEITLKGRGAETRRIDTAGGFVLRRISDTATLTTQ